MSGPFRFAPSVRLREPTTILARPSAVTCSRVAWLALAVVTSVTVLAPAGLWAPWMLVPLVVAAAVTDGAWSAGAWAIAGGLALDLAPPAASSPGLAIVPAVASALAAARFAPAWNGAAWMPAALGALGAAAASTAVVAIHIVLFGSAGLDVTQAIGSILTTAVLTALTAPPWVCWTWRQHDQGRA